jgi:hypothetical protein
MRDHHDHRDRHLGLHSLPDHLLELFQHLVQEPERE